MMLAKFFEGVRLAIVESGQGERVANAVKKMIGHVSCDKLGCFRLEREGLAHARCPSCAHISEITL